MSYHFCFKRTQFLIVYLCNMLLYHYHIAFLRIVGAPIVLPHRTRIHRQWNTDNLSYAVAIDRVSMCAISVPHVAMITVRYLIVGNMIYFLLLIPYFGLSFLFVHSARQRIRPVPQKIQVLYICL